MKRRCGAGLASSQVVMGPASPEGEGMVGVLSQRRSWAPTLMGPISAPSQNDSQSNVCNRPGSAHLLS